MVLYAAHLWALCFGLGYYHGCSVWDVLQGYLVRLFNFGKKAARMHAAISAEDKHRRMAKTAQAELGDNRPCGGPHVLEWMAKHVKTLDDWKGVEFALLSYVLRWRVGELVLWSPKRTDVRGTTFWSIKMIRRLVYKKLGLVP